jgi:N-acetylglutamate synthase
MSDPAPQTSLAFAIRPMTAADLPAARALWSRAEGVELAEGDEEFELAGFLQRNPGMSQVAFSGVTLVGAVLAGHDGRRGYLYHLAVAPSARGHGLGRELVSRALPLLKQQGLRRALLLVATDNASGKAFWSRCGWEQLDLAEPMGIDL